MIASDFAVADKFHVYFYHGFMEDWERDTDRLLVHDFMQQLLELIQNVKIGIQHSITIVTQGEPENRSHIELETNPVFF